MSNRILKKSHVLVIGDILLDSYLWGECQRISPEAPVQCVDINDETISLGGAGNVISNLKSLACNVSTIAVVGDDKNGDTLVKLLESCGVDSHLVIEPGRKTPKKTRIMASHQHVLRFDIESTQDIQQESARGLLKYMSEIIRDIDIVIFSDYDKGTFTKALTPKLIGIAQKHKKKILIDPKGREYDKYKGAYLLTPNKKEAAIATGLDIKDEESIKEALIRLKQKAHLSVSVITLGDQGIAYLDDRGYQRIPAVAKEVFDVTGAGDTVISTLAYALSEGKTLDHAIEYANYAAGIVISKLGSATATLAEINELRDLHNPVNEPCIINSPSEIHDFIERAKIAKKRIVFTNGCFDIIHMGHVAYLEKAKALGEILIVGLNSDTSVSKLKGENRPINNQHDRAFILSRLKSVDYVIIFEDDTPYDLIRRIEPDILVKGSDYKNQEIVGSDIAKQVTLIDFIDGYSTTALINKGACQE